MGQSVRVMYLIERPEIWPDGKNRPVLWGCYRTLKSAKLVAKRTDCVGFGSIKYGKQRVIKFQELT